MCEAQTCEYLENFKFTGSKLHNRLRNQDKQMNESFFFIDLNNVYFQDFLVHKFIHSEHQNDNYSSFLDNYSNISLSKIGPAIYYPEATIDELSKREPYHIKTPRIKYK